MVTKSNRRVYSSILLNNYHKNASIVFDDPKRIRNIMHHIHKYIDRNSEVLNYPAPTKRMPFNVNGEDGNIIFDNMDITDTKQMQTMINKIERSKAKSAVLKTPLVVSITLLLREAVLRNKRNEANTLMMYLVFAFYWSLQYRQIKFEPPEAVVQYTLNNASNRFYFKTKGTLFAVLHDVAEVNHKSSTKFLISEDDDDILTYIMNIRTRVSSTLVRFTELLMKNIESKEYLNTVADSNDEENYYETQSLSSEIEKVVSKSIMYFYKNKIDMKMINISSKLNSTPPNMLKGVMENIKTEEQIVFERLVRAAIKIYFKDNRASIEKLGTKQFVAISMALFAKSNSNDKDVAFVKEELEKLLNKYSETYLQTTRQATKVNYRKSIYCYIVLHIVYSVNN